MEGSAAIRPTPATREERAHVLQKTCATCGAVSEQTYCPAHRRRDREPVRVDTTTGEWKRLSKKARQLQPFCLLCGATQNLALDHSPRAWARQEKGQRIRLEDTTVLCQRCNNRAGSSKPGSLRYRYWETIHESTDATTSDDSLYMPKSSHRGTSVGRAFQDGYLKRVQRPASPSHNQVYTQGGRGSQGSGHLHVESKFGSLTR